MFAAAPWYHAFDVVPDTLAPEQTVVPVMAVYVALVVFGVYVYLVETCAYAFAAAINATIERNNLLKMGFMVYEVGGCNWLRLY